MPITTKFCTVTITKYSSWVVPTRVKEIQDGGRPPSLKIENRPYLRNGLTDLREVWHADAYWASEPDRKLKFPTFKNPRWRTDENLEKWKICHRTISINAKACSCQKGHTPSRPELYATLSTLPISPNKTAKIIKTKTDFSIGTGRCQKVCGPWRAR